MANLKYSAKSGGDWGRNELLSYHITVTPIPPQEFFRQSADPSLTGLDPALVRSPLGSTNVSDDTYHFLSYLDLATNADQETAIDDFAREPLHIVGFEERGCVLRTCHIIPLSICGDINKVAQTDVCLLDRRSTIFLILQDSFQYSRSRTTSYRGSHRSVPAEQPEAGTLGSIHARHHDCALHHHDRDAPHVLLSARHTRTE